MALRRLVARLVAAGVDSIGLLGSTGTYAYLTRAERRRALDTALAEAAGRTPIVVGIGALRTDAAVKLAQDAKAAGAAGRAARAGLLHATAGRRGVRALPRRHRRQRPAGLHLR